MQSVFPLLYLVAIAAMSYARPAMGLVLACGAYLAGAMGGSSEGGGSWISVAGPMCAFLFCGARLLVTGAYRRIRFDSTDAVMILLFVCTLASTLYSRFPATSLEYSLRFLFLGASFYFFGKVVALIYPDRDALVEDFAWGANIGAAVFAVIALSMSSSASQHFLRLTIGESSAIPLAVYLGQGLVATVVLLLTRQGYAKLLYLVTTLPVIGYAFLATNTRSVVLGFALSLGVLMLSAASSLRKRVIFGMLSVGALVCTGFFYLYTQHPETIARLVNASGRVGAGSFGESEGERVVAWSDAWNIFSESPLMGIGSGSFMEMYGLYPHNALLELGAETGIVGLLLLSVLIARCLAASVRQAVSGDGRVAAMFAFHLIVAMVSMSFWMHKLLFLSIALLFAHGSAGLSPAPWKRSAAPPRIA